MPYQLHNNNSIFHPDYFRASHVSKAWHKMIRKEEKNASERVSSFLAKKQGYCERKGKVINVQLIFFRYLRYESSTSICLVLVCVKLSVHQVSPTALHELLCDADIFLRHFQTFC